MQLMQLRQLRLPRKQDFTWKKTALLIGGVLVLAALIWGGYVLATLISTESKIHKDMPQQALAPLTPMPVGTEPRIFFPSPTAQAVMPATDTVATDMATPGVASPSAVSEPTDTVYIVPTDTPVLTTATAVATPGPSPTPNLKATATALENKSSIKSWNGKTRLNLLLLGVDERYKGELSRSDTIILVSLDFKHNQAYVVSIARDLYVNIPGFGYNKINAAYPIGENPEYSSKVGGGLGLLINTLRQNFGIDRIDGFGIIDFQGFVDGVNALGGITVDVPHKLVDPAYPTRDYKIKRLVFKAGKQHMNGQRALEYSRTRHPDTDFGRMRRQQQVLLAVKDKARSPSIIIHAPSLLRAVGNNVKTNLSISDQVKLARWAEALPKKNLHFYSIIGPIGNTDTGMSVVWPQWDKINPILKEVFGPDAGHRS